MLPFKSKNPQRGVAGSHASSSSGSSMASPHVHHPHTHTHEHHHHHHTPGPIIKVWLNKFEDFYKNHKPVLFLQVREKTERSMPMSKTPRTPVSPHQNGTGGSSADSEVSGILSTSRRSSADLLSPGNTFLHNNFTMNDSVSLISDAPVPGGPRSSAGRVNGASSSRPSSRGVSNIPAPTQTSRPPSRAGSDVSDVSLRSHDSLSAATPTRIPSARKRIQK